MKILLLAVGAVLCSIAAFSQSNLFPTDGRVGIGTVSPDTSAILQINSSQQGILIPRMNKNQRDSIHVPGTGLLIYQTNSTPGFYYYNGTSWTPLTIVGANATLSNLTSTSVNVNLESSADNTITLGDSEKKWNNLYAMKVAVDGDVFVSDGGSKGASNTFIGVSHNILVNTGTKNVWVGTDAGKFNTTGYDNVSVGRSAGMRNAIGSRNCSLGMNAGLATTGGLKNTFLGYSAGRANVTGLSNVFVGYRSGGKNTSAGFNAFYGDLTGNLNVTGTQNVYFGSHSGSLVTTSNNTFVGYSSGAQLTTGTNCTFIGAYADATVSTVTNSIAIGYLATIDQSNVIRLGNSDVAKVGIGCTPLSDDILDFQMTTAKLTSGGVWTNASDKKLKNNFRDVDANDFLNKVSQLKIQRWHYIADPDACTHIGPVAQDFHRLFDAGDDTTISTIDPSGVALLSVQALTEKGRVKDATIAQQQVEIDELKSMINDMQQSLSSCCMNNQNSDEQNYGLEQNVTNPFSAKTILKCYVPSEIKSAILIISSHDGEELKSYPLSNGGANVITIDGGVLPAGEYICTLMVDGKKIDSNRMVLTP